MLLTVDLYYFDDLVARFRVDTKQKQLIKRELVGDNPVAQKMDTFQSLYEFICSRQVDFGRISRPKMLGYERTNVAPDVWHEMGITFGFDADDYFWVKIPELTPKARIDWTWRDFHFKVNPQAKSVYYCC